MDLSTWMSPKLPSFTVNVARYDQDVVPGSLWYCCGHVAPASISALRILL